MTLDRAWMPAALCACLLALGAGAAAQEASLGLDTTYERKEQVSGFWLLFVGGDQSYRMSPEVHDAHRKLWPFLKRGEKIHVTLQGRQVQRLERGWKSVGKVDARAVQRQVRICKEGDRIKINGLEYLFLRADQTHVVASPKRSDGKGFAGEVRIALTSVETFERIAAAATTSADDLAPDVIEMFKVEVGDTVDVYVGESQTPLHGAFSKLSNNAAELREWGPSGWGDLRRLVRKDITKVRHVTLERTYALEVDGEKMLLTLSRMRRAIEGPMELKLELGHQSTGAVFTGAKLRVQLSEQLGQAHTPEAEEIIEVPPLLAGETHRHSHTVLHVRYTDVALRLEGGKFLPFSDPKARSQVLKALDLGPPIDQLQRLYEGLGKSGEELPLRFLLDRELYPPTRQGEDPAEHARAARRGLEAGGPKTVELLMSELRLPFDKMTSTVLTRGELVREPLAEALDRKAHCEKLARLLGQLPRSIDGVIAKALFELSVERNDLGKAIQLAFAFQPERVVGVLLEEVVPSNGEPPHKERAERATMLLKDLAGKMIDLLPDLITGRGVPSKELVDAIGRFGNEDPVKVVDVALRLAQHGVRSARAARADATVGEARELAGKKEWKAALDQLQEVLSQVPDHAGAKALLGTVQVGQARALAASGRTDEAVVLFEKALEGGEPAAKQPLAGLLGAALAKEATGVVLRSQPRLASSIVGMATPGTPFRGRAADVPGWLELATGQGAVFGRADCFTPGGGGSYQPQERTPEPAILELVQRIESLDPSQAPQAQRALADWYGALATSRYEAGQYAEARALLKDKVEPLAPRHPSLSLASMALLRANLLLIGGLTIAFLGGATVLVWLVKREKERRALEQGGVAINLFGGAEGSEAESLEIDLFGGIPGEDETAPLDGPPPDFGEPPA
ncbi:MAG: hypothetical protein AB7N76_12120 [Planctomycetota bacterium]